MSKKSIFLWSLAAGIAATGGLSGIIYLLMFALLFWVAEKAFDGFAAFVRGWRSSADARRDSPKPRPTLRVIKGGAA